MRCCARESRGSDCDRDLHNPDTRPRATQRTGPGPRESHSQPNEQADFVENACEVQIVSRGGRSMEIAVPTNKSRPGIRRGSVSMISGCCPEAREDMC